MEAPCDHALATNPPQQTSGPHAFAVTMVEVRASDGMKVINRKRHQFARRDRDDRSVQRRAMLQKKGRDRILDQPNSKNLDRAFATIGNRCQGADATIGDNNIRVEEDHCCVRGVRIGNSATIAGRLNEVLILNRRWIIGDEIHLDRHRLLQPSVRGRSLDGFAIGLCREEMIEGTWTTAQGRQVAGGEQRWKTSVDEAPRIRVTPDGGYNVKSGLHR